MAEPTRDILEELLKASMPSGVDMGDGGSVVPDTFASEITAASTWMPFPFRPSAPAARLSRMVRFRWEIRDLVYRIRQAYDVLRGRHECER